MIFCIMDKSTPFVQYSAKKKVQYKKMMKLKLIFKGFLNSKPLKIFFIKANLIFFLLKTVQLFKLFPLFENVETSCVSPYHVYFRRIFHNNHRCRGAA